MKAQCTLSFEFKNVEIAKKVLQAIQIDDEGFVTSTIKGKKLVACVTSKSVASLLHTVDDYLACVSVAEGIVNKD